MKSSLPYYAIQVATNKDDDGVQDNIVRTILNQLQTHLSKGETAKADQLKEHFGIDKELTDFLQIEEFIKTHVVIVAKENIEEIKNGRKREAKRKMFANYIFIRMKYNNDYGILINRVPGVLSFVGMSNVSEEPEKVLKEDIDRVLQSISESKEKAKLNVEFARGDKVRIISGPFIDFDAEVLEVDHEHSKSVLTVSVRVFGRETSVRLDFAHVEKYG